MATTKTKMPSIEELRGRQMKAMISNSNEAVADLYEVSLSQENFVTDTEIVIAALINEIAELKDKVAALEKK